VPKGFKVNLFASGTNARSLAVAPNGDVFVSDRRGKHIKAFRSSNGETADTMSIFAEGFNNPHGIAFYPNNVNPTHLYVASVTNVVRFPYTKGDLKASGPAEVIVPSITDVGGNHWTRSLTFTPDGKLMLLTVGSATNVATETIKNRPESIEEWDAKHGLGGAWGVEENRAAIFSFNPDGSNKQVYATGVRNCVGFVVHPATNDVLCSVNERDGLGDNLPPDYFSRIPKGSFFGWPWYYIGDNEDPRHAGARPDLKGKVRVPDVLIQAHSAPLGMAVYQAPKKAKNYFGKEYDGHVFLALHGSWNRAARAGNKLVRIPMRNGVPTGEYEDFMTGFIISNNSVWGRPASVAIAQDGAVLVGDDAFNGIWRITPDSNAAKK
jgi:glucose/arabinose dehydrogenase